MSDYLKRLSYLKSTLKADAYTSSDLVDLLCEEGFTVSKRQMQRDLISLHDILSEDEKLNTYFQEGSKYFYIKALTNISHDTSGGNSNSAVNTEFYTQYLTPSKLKTIEVIEEALFQKKRLEISLVKDDLTGDNLELDSHESTVCPIELIYHRNSYYLGCYNLTKKRIDIYGITQLEQIKLGPTYSGYKDYKKILDLELNKRFGVTKNIDDKVYDIEIEFTSATGRFIEDHHWHPTQKVIKSKGNYILTLQCGINRELIGWIFLWMYNVKILNPPKLKSLYEKTLQECQLTSKGETPFVYRNIFNH